MKTPGILQIVGGLLVLLGGVAIVAFGSLLGATGFGAMGMAAGLLGGVHIVFGIIIILAGLWHEKNPAWSWVGLVFSLLSLMAGGGLILGPFMANIGAAMSMKSRTKGK